MIKINRGILEMEGSENIICSEISTIIKAAKDYSHVNRDMLNYAIELALVEDPKEYAKQKNKILREEKRKKFFRRFFK